VSVQLVPEDRLHRVVAAAAGRRIDPPGAVARFPAANEAVVRERVRELLRLRCVGTLVSSAACGADLIALEVAGELGIRRVVVLPSDLDTFREKSVTDRGGDWGPRFDRVIASLRATNDLRRLEAPAAGESVYALTNEAVVTLAKAIAAESAPDSALAMVVWDGVSRGNGDFTEHFKQTALNGKLEIVEISTL